MNAMTNMGRLDIHYPDGRTESHVLADDQCSIGSAVNNTIQILGAGLAEQQFRISRRGAATYLTLLGASPYATIDGLPLAVNDPQPLSEFAQIQIGELSIIFNRRSDMPTVAIDAVSERTQPTARGFRAQLKSGEIHVWPCSSASAMLSITNLTDEISQFSIETAGLPAEWTTPRRLIFSVNGGDSLEIMLQIAPPRRADIAPGTYPLSISVSRLDPDESTALLVLLVQLGGFAGLSIALDPPLLRPQTPFRVFLLNLGNEDLPLNLRPHDPGRLLDIRLARAELRLGAGERAVISGDANLKRRRIFGPPALIPFALLAEAQKPDSYVVCQPATVIVDPVVSNRLLIGALLAIVIALLALAALIIQPPQPNIAAFALSHQQVAQGTPVKLTWNAADVERFVIEAGRAPIAELPGEALSFSLDTSGYVDPIDIALIALNGDATDIESRRLEVYQPVTVTRFEANKTALLRNIRGDLTINWRIVGAIAIDIALPLGFETIRETIAGEAGEIVIQGEPADDFQVILSAQDEIGGTTTRAIAISVSEPECAPVRDTRLHKGPDTGFARANDAVQNVPVLVNGISADKTWLQVELASGDRGWGLRTNFRCQGFDPADLNVIADIPQLPTLTPAPTHNATATSTTTPASSIDEA